MAALEEARRKAEHEPAPVEFPLVGEQPVMRRQPGPAQAEGSKIAFGGLRTGLIAAHAKLSPGQEIPASRCMDVV